MAVSGNFYTSFFTELAKGTHVFGTDTFKLALLDNSHSFDATDDVWGDISANEVAGTGYTAGGAALANVSVTTDDTNTRAEIDFDDVEWTSSTISAYHGAVYNDDKSDKLVCSIDLDGLRETSRGTFKLEVPSEGMIHGEEA